MTISAIVTPAVRPACRERLTRILDLGLSRHPVLTTTAAMLLLGSGMVLAVGLCALTCVLPLSLLLGWY